MGSHTAILCIQLGITESSCLISESVPPFELSAFGPHFMQGFNYRLREAGEIPEGAVIVFNEAKRKFPRS